MEVKAPRKPQTQQSSSTRSMHASYLILIIIKVEYDDFGDEIRTQSVFEDVDFISQQASLYYDSYYVTFLADGPHFKVIFVDELLPENDVLLQVQ